MTLGRVRRHLARREPTQPAPFVVGVTRSGTTLLRLMLDAHPQLAVPPETHFALEVIAAFKEGPVTPERFVAIVTGHRRWPDFGLDADVLRARVSEAQPLAAGPALRAFYRYYADQAGKPRWGDKTPGYLRKMSSIERALPEARFIHLIRDGRDVAVSITGLHFGPRSVPKAAHRWAKRIRVAREQGRRVGHYTEVRYEDLVLEPEATLRRICAFVELDWDPAMLDYHDRAADRLQEITRDLPRSREGEVIRADQRVGIHALASRPPQSDRVGRWRTEMSDSDQAAFVETAGDLLAELGYPTG
ncbi:MAG: sulfotransferase family protein [Solirubrobacteraceae bacterium]